MSISNSDQADFNKNSKSLVTYGKTQSTESSGPIKPAPIQPQIQDPYQHQAKILAIRIQAMRNMHSPFQNIQHNANKYKNLFEQPYALRRSNKFGITEIKKFLDATIDNQTISQSYSKPCTQHDMSISSAFSAQKKTQKKNKELKGIVNDFNFNFIKHCFRHYHEVFVNLVIMVEQEFDQSEEFEPLVPNRGNCGEDVQFFKHDLMYPPPYSNKDFKFDPEKIMFRLELIREQDHYKTQKVKSLIFLRIAILTLINIFSITLPKLFSQNLSEGQFRQEIVKVLPSRKKKENSNLFYETRYLLEEVTTMAYRQYITKPQKTIEMAFIKKFCKQKLINFIESLTIYNLTTTIYCHYKQQQLPITYYHKMLSGTSVSSYTQKKINLFLSTLSTPDILKRIFTDSVSYDTHAKQIIENLNNKPYNISTFSSRIYTSLDQQNLITYLSKYLIHYLQYGLEVANAMTETSTSSLETAYNSVRFINMFLVSIFIKKAIARIVREIQFYHGPFVADKITREIETNIKFTQNFFKLNKNIRNSYSKVQSYLNDIKAEKKSTNVEKIKHLMQNDPLNEPQKLNIIQFIKLLYKQNQQKVNVPPLQDIKLMKIIYRYIIRLISTECVCRKNLQRCFKKITDSHFQNKVISYQEFLAGKPINQASTNFQKYQDFQNCMKEFQRNFKIVQIEMLQLYITSMTLWCYSFAVQEEGQRKKNNQNGQDKEQKKIIINKMTSKKLLINLDMAYIMDGYKVSPLFLKGCNLTKINELLIRYTKLGKVLNDYFQNFGEMKQFDEYAIKMILLPERQTIREVQVPVHNGQVEYLEDEDLKTQHIKMNRSAQKFFGKYKSEEQQLISQKKIEVLDLNKIMNRRIQKDKLSIFGLQDSWEIGRAIYEDFKAGPTPIMVSDMLMRNLQLPYSYMDKQHKVYQSQSLASTKSSSISSKTSSNKQK